MSTRAAATATLLATGMLVGCGGIPGDYRDALGIERGAYGARTCAGGSAEPVLTAIFGVEVPGDEPVEFIEVVVADGNVEPSAVFLVSTSTEATVGFGTARQSTIAESDDVVAAAWHERSRLPASAVSGRYTELVAVLPAPSDEKAWHQVREFDITVAVGDDVETFSWRSEHTIGQGECEGPSAPVETDL